MKRLVFSAIENPGIVIKNCFVELVRKINEYNPVGDYKWITVKSKPLDTDDQLLLSYARNTAFLINSIESSDELIIDCESLESVCPEIIGLALGLNLNSKVYYHNSNTMFYDLDEKYFDLRDGSFIYQENIYTHENIEITKDNKLIIDSLTENNLIPTFAVIGYLLLDPDFKETNIYYDASIDNIFLKLIGFVK